MSTALEDYQFELLPGVDTASGEVFGIGRDISMDDGGFLPGDDDWQVEDESNPRRGGVAFGRDTLSGPTWGFNLHVNIDEETTAENVALARDTLARFKAAWRALEIRREPGELLPLRYKLGGKVRRVYGRPRRFSAPPNNLILSGFVPITCDFQCVDGFTYDDAEQVLVLGLQQGSEGGLIFPAVFPTETLPVSSSQQQAVVGGDASTYPTVRFNGPVTNPSLDTADWSLALAMTIPQGSYVEIDLRPWAISAMLNGTSSVAGSLDRRTYLADMALKPGRHTMIFRGSTAIESATCEVRWSDASNSI